MNNLEVKICPNPCLRKKAGKIENIDSDIITMVNNMFDIMYKAPGIGLAANQVGVLKRLIIIDIDHKTGPEKPIVLINPTILSSYGEVTDEEGCLSIPDIFGEVKRKKEIEVEGVDINGKTIKIETTGLLARVLQHEIDHLDGFLFWDRINKVKRDILKRTFKKKKKDNI